jgi:excisionase family DNA binding protein
MSQPSVCQSYVGFGPVRRVCDFAGRGSRRVDIHGMARRPARRTATDNSSTTGPGEADRHLVSLPRPVPSERLLDVHEVAGLLGVSHEYVWQLSREGRIPTITLGRIRRYRRESVLGWLSEIESPRSGA